MKAIRDTYFYVFLKERCSKASKGWFKNYTRRFITELGLASWNFRERKTRCSIVSGIQWRVTVWWAKTHFRPLAAVNCSSEARFLCGKSADHLVTASGCQSCWNFWRVWKFRKISTMCSHLYRKIINWSIFMMEQWTLDVETRNHLAWSVNLYHWDPFFSFSNK